MFLIFIEMMKKKFKKKRKYRDFTVNKNKLKFKLKIILNNYFSRSTFHP